MEPTVSIFMLAYNQEEFIGEAIEGVLMQKTDFNFQLVIGEDRSTDRTREICKNYKDKNPGKIKLLLNEKNIGLGANYVKTYRECTGKYVAICDGDDYWTDPFKLQKQVDFLESKSDYKIIFTNNWNIYPSGKKEVRDIKTIKETTDFKDLVFNNYMASVTALFRNRPLPTAMEKWMCNFPYADWPTYLWVVKDGSKIKFLNENTSVYRKDWGTSAELRKIKSKIGKINLTILLNMKESGLFQENLQDIDKSIIKYQIGLLSSYNKERKYLRSLGILSNLLFKVSPVHLIKIYIYSLKRSIENGE